MTQQLTAEDIQTRDRLRKQRKAGTLDEAMEPYLNWLEGRRKDAIQDTQKTVYNKARAVLNKYLKVKTHKQAYQEFGIYPALITRLQTKQYSKVPYQTAKQIANFK